MSLLRRRGYPFRLRAVLGKIKKARAEAQRRRGKEVFAEGRWNPVIRYDSAHGFPHIDRYSKDGRKTKKALHLEFDEALVLADEDIKENWKKYQRSFLEGH